MGLLPFNSQPRIPVQHVQLQRHHAAVQENRGFPGRRRVPGSEKILPAELVREAEDLVLL